MTSELLAWERPWPGPKGRSTAWGSSSDEKQGKATFVAVWPRPGSGQYGIWYMVWYGI